jgi:hypothetical protein
MTRKLQIFMILALLAHLPWLAFSQQKNKPSQRVIEWTGIKSFSVNETDSVKYISFDNATYSGNLPYFSEKIKLSDYYSRSVEITDDIYAECSQEETTLLASVSLKTSVEIFSDVALEKKLPYLCINIFPFRKNNATGKTEKLVSFNLKITKGATVSKLPLQQKNTYATSSVLASGDWFKIAVSQSGIYSLNYQDLVSLGIDVNSIDPRNIRIYGNGGGILPENNFEARHDDLVENPIYVSGESDGVFDASDYVLFYGDGPVQWQYNAGSKLFTHQTNYYDNVTTYFLTADLGAGKRIQQQASSSLPADYTVTKFQDYACHEKDSFNLVTSGKEWYGENLDILTSYSFNFSFPDIDLSSKVKIRTDIAGRYTSSNLYKFTADGNSYTSTVSGVGIGSYTFANTKSDTYSFNASGSTIGVSVEKITSGAIGWLNYIELEATRNLNYSGSQIIFRDTSSVGTGTVSEFVLGNSTSAIKIWDITDPVNPVEQQYTLSGNDGVFRILTDTLREFIAFNGTSYLKPILTGRTENQNLHALDQADFIIVAYPDFVGEANRLASLHETHDGLSSVVVTPSQIYNEFSSGNQDISAIRDFAKMFYDRASSAAELPKYLLLLGDASYDYKNRITDNTNYVPTYESLYATSFSDSYASDDFFGFLDDAEGPYEYFGLLDIGVGRFPVKSVSEAKYIVDKVAEYMSISNPFATSEGCSNYTLSSSDEWKNIICFVADDEENNSFLVDCDDFATYIDTTFNNYNIDKIYCDAYVQETGAGGQRYPDVNDAINKRVEKGALIINYIGHGGEVGWALERILQIADINSWSNLHSLPLFITATCEFSRYDDPNRTSAGELVLLKSDGGGIALLTTSRLAYAPNNAALVRRFYQNAFIKVNGEYPSMGDLIRLSKNNTGTGNVDSQIRNFVLLGDPALKLAYPENKVLTTKVNQHDTLSVIDTLKALQKVTIAGIIADEAGLKMNDFNGVVYPTVYDKKTTTYTLGNDPTSHITPFIIQKSILYKGKVSVTDGDFSFSFVIPKDIAYNYGEGRISYYASNGITDANGYYENSYFIIGGSDTTADLDSEGPEIRLYLNDSNFVSGGMTNENPLLLAFVKDTSGINTVGNGIGHDIVAVLDGNTSNSIVLNDYYEADLNSYQKGTIRYPLEELSDGEHTLSLKVWDIYNNSSEASINFYVSQSAELALDHVLNYPNPFTTHTEFYFEHNQPCCNLDVQIQIFTVTGKLVKTIRENVLTDGFRAEPISWDGLDDFGDPIAKGVYLYKLRIVNSDGSAAEKTEKLVILR